METSNSMDVVLSVLDDEDRQRMLAMGFGAMIGFGARPALVLIDVQNYMVGPPAGSSNHYPSACAAAVPALPNIGRLVDVCRATDVPVFYTRFELERDGSDAGIYRLKRGIPDTEGWCLTGTEGADIVDAVAPADGDTVFVKKKPSAFAGTPLTAYLIERSIDTLIIVGGATSNCVRATVVDAAALNFRPIVPYDAVFDRFDISHRTALFDIQRQFGDVMSTADIVATLQERTRTDTSHA